MFPLNTIIAWSINIIMNKKYDNNNIIIASRAYFLQPEAWRRRQPSSYCHGSIVQGRLLMHHSGGRHGDEEGLRW
jgi:hypothetical protein